jgi:hypothetical protein
MQALEGSSPGARDALLALSVDLRLPHHDVIKALEYAWDNSSSHPSAAAALDFGFIMQGCFVDIRVLEMALQRLRRNFGSQCCGVYRLETRLMFQGILGPPTAQHVSLQEWSIQPSAWGNGQPSRSAVTAPTQHASLQESSAQSSTWNCGQPLQSAVNTPAQHVYLQERSAQTSACSGGQPLRSEVPTPLQPTTTTVPGSSERVFNSNSNSGNGNGNQHTASRSGSSQHVFNPNFGNGYQHTSARSGSSPSQQMYSTSGTHVTGSPNVANDPAEVQYTGQSTGWNPSYHHKTPKSGS